MNSHSLTRFSAGLALAAAALSAWAAAELPPEHHAGSVSYVSGGVSDDEAATFKAFRDSYPLSIELVRHRGGRNEYTADAQVKVMDASGQVVLDAKSDGPFMLVRVPPGQYRVEATLDGQTVQSQAVTVGQARHAQAFVAFRGN